MITTIEKNQILTILFTESKPSHFLLSRRFSPETKVKLGLYIS